MCFLLLPWMSSSLDLQNWHLRSRNGRRQWMKKLWLFTTTIHGLWFRVDQRTTSLERSGYSGSKQRRMDRSTGTRLVWSQMACDKSTGWITWIPSAQLCSPFDVSNAFLHGDLNERIVVSQPLGFRDSSQPDSVCLLRKSLYGLKQSPHCWFHKLRQVLHKFGLKDSRIDPSLFISKEGSPEFHVYVYADDIIKMKSTGSSLSWKKNSLLETWEIFSSSSAFKYQRLMPVFICHKCNICWTFLPARIWWILDQRSHPCCPMWIFDRKEDQFPIQVSFKGLLAPFNIWR